MFRLVKVNSDKEPQLSQTLGVSGLPTVFAVNGGKLTDRCSLSLHLLAHTLNALLLSCVVLCCEVLHCVSAECC